MRTVYAHVVPMYEVGYFFLFHQKTNTIIVVGRATTRGRPNLPIRAAVCFLADDRTDDGGKSSSLSVSPLHGVDDVHIIYNIKRTLTHMLCLQLYDYNEEKIQIQVITYLIILALKILMYKIPTQ